MLNKKHIIPNSCFPGNEFIEKNIEIIHKFLQYIKNIDKKIDCLNIPLLIENIITKASTINVET